MTTIYDKIGELERHILSSLAPVFLTKRIYLSNFDQELDLKNPKTINEKLQYLKLNTYYNDPVVTQCADKYGIRSYLKNKGMEYLCPELYGVYDSVKEIDWNALPDSFVLKCNHGCGYNIIVPDKARFDPADAARKLSRWMKEDYWKEYCETQYKFIKKKIIAEEYLGDELNTYKFYCFNGEPKVLYVSATGDHGEHDLYIDYYDMEWNHLDTQLADHIHRPPERALQKPDTFDEMKKLARILSSEFPFVRVDLYDVRGKVMISELTFIPTGGYMHLEPEGTDLEWGEWLKLDL
ncbi:MAG: glycosyl transferase [Solobacterium sp.]|nr:glycosyl transferase [Solobacterium sp.]